MKRKKVEMISQSKPDTSATQIEKPSFRDCTEERIAILTDSCTDTPVELRDKYPIYTVALHVNYKDKSYLDRVNITPEEVYERLGAEVPTTSTPTVQQIADTFEQIIKDGYTHVICINISSNISGTHNLVELTSLDFSQLEIAAVDTLNIGFGSGFVVKRACELLDQKLSFNELVCLTKEAVQNTYTFFVVDTLDYLYQGGRISKAVFSVGSVLNIKPILTCDEHGKYVIAGKARGKNGALRKARELISKVTDEKPFHLAVVNGNAVQEAARVLTEARNEFANVRKSFDAGQISPVLTVHTGPGLIGLIVQMA